MRPLPDKITDPIYHEPTRYSRYQQFWLKHIHDKRDLPFIRLLTIIHLTIIPVGIFLFTDVLKDWHWWVAAGAHFYFSQFYFKGPFGLMFHCISHRKFFKSHPHLLNKYLCWFVCPFFGHVGDSYQVHHIGMHHIENNMPTDVSCTMGYRRDSFSEFMKYWLRFMFLGLRDVCAYLFIRKRNKMRRKVTISEIGFFIIATGLCFIDLRATLIVIIIPFIFARLVMMIGNWTQHAFVDQNEPDNDLASNIICLNSSYNQKCWNDGYHAIHHVRPGAHYTDIPVIFKKMIPDVAKNRTIVFERIHYLHIFFYLMRKRYDKLAENLVNINGAFLNQAEAISLMKTRTKKFDLKSFSENRLVLEKKVV